MNLSKMKYLSGMMLIGDGVAALVRPHRDVYAWHTGPAAWQGLMRYLDERPALTRAIGAAEIAAGMLLLGGEKPTVKQLVEDIPLGSAA